MSHRIRALASGLASLAMASSFALPAARADAPAKSDTFVFHASLADGLGFRTEQDKFVLDAGVLSQMRFDAISNSDGLASDGFNVAVVRPYIRARAFHDQVRFFVQPELATATPKLLDLEIAWQPMPELGIKVGQFLTPFSRAFFTPVPILQFPDFSRVNEKFRAGRDTGMMLFGSTGKGRLEYYAGAFNGNGIDKGGNDDTSVMGIGRLAVNPVRAMPYDETPSLRGAVPFGLSIGVNGIADRAHPTKQQTDPATGAQTTVALPAETRLTAGADVFIAWDRFTFLAEAYARQVQPDEGKRIQGFGGYAQAGYFVVPKRFEIAARAGVMDPDTSKPDTERSVEGLLNGYVVGNHLKMGLRYMWLRTDAKTADGYAAGTNHKLTFQVQLWI
ncbi:porin [Polyangium sorediatum]|uniref:Porin n=1 Tax=Polyangium sorediatum TaxID=889274 RepID=A0ABT6NSP2_9BACT|nr:porin [Polyangium sorediatum]MDI1431346.1 porin [Polyangium sorediatum]